MSDLSPTTASGSFLTEPELQALSWATLHLAKGYLKAVAGELQDAKNDGLRVETIYRALSRSQAALRMHTLPPLPDLLQMSVE